MEGFKKPTVTRLIRSLIAHARNSCRCLNMGVSDGSEASSNRLTTGEKTLIKRWKASKPEDESLLVASEKQPEGRRLAAIVFTDIVGYTAMAQKNEALAVKLLEEHRNILRPIFQKHNGLEIDTVGDGFLVEFASALDAVRCSIEIQSALKESNVQRPDEWKILLRIGIHLGDVIHKNNHVYGDSVNIASRIGPLCAPGSLCITEQVYSQVRNKIDRTFNRLRRKKLKNVETPVEVYSLTN